MNDNDFDFEGDTLTVTPGVFVGTYGTLTLNANGTYSYALNATAQTLAQGQIVQDSFTYTVSDGSAAATPARSSSTSPASTTRPVANPDTATTERECDDPGRRPRQRHRRRQWRGADRHRRLGAGRARARASVVGNQVEFDPGTDFDDLAVGESEDGRRQLRHRGRAWRDRPPRRSRSPSPAPMTGRSPIPTPTRPARMRSILIDVLANDTDVDNGAVLTVIAASAPPGQGTASRRRQPGPVRSGHRLRLSRRRRERGRRRRLHDRGRAWRPVVLHRHDHGRGPRRGRRDHRHRRRRNADRHAAATTRSTRSAATIPSSAWPATISSTAATASTS